ncbi:Sporulation related domain-containing protein [Desulfuromusa kysingii]|uniref:Sporulation related domain-containing protein n=2 Tax=Desulfuromusa kysingii TaxID=37625 RepID=A0A1H3WYI2_9BACT|nr:Sporulation related domain-containing protein [Desulfuromusa kysingii]
MEKRQAVILLVLVLAVSLASFTLGVIVGRRGAERDLTQKYQQAERVLVAHAPVPIVEPAAEPDRAKAVDVPETEVVADEPKLSFYDDLEKETVPLGSGINLEPIEKIQAAETTQPPIDLPDQPIVTKSSPKVAVSTTVKKQNKPAAVVADRLPKATVGGSHAVQMGSFGAPGDAIALKQKMVDKGYPAFVVEADLGTKGLWYRVRIGPYADAETAVKAQEYLQEKDKIKGFITRQ